MFKRILLVAVWCLGFLGNANAGLATSSTWNSMYPDVAGVQFNQNSFNGVTIGLGAHAYKNGVLLPNDGVSTFYAPTGQYLGNAPADGRANWSFDFFVNAGTYCQSCLRVLLQMDADPSANADLRDFGKQGLQLPVVGDSWNLEMDFLEGLNGPFDPNANGTYDFVLSVFDTDAIDSAMVTTSIRVVVGEVPEPGIFALMALALVAFAFVHQRRNSAGYGSTSRY